MKPQSDIECGTESLDSRSAPYTCCGNRVPKNQFTYISQILVIYAIIVTSIVHLSLKSEDHELWLILLSSSLGYILPSPGLKFAKNNQAKTAFDFIDGKK